MNPVDLVVSDVDGTLVTPDKRLTRAAVEAVRQLHARGIGFTVTSSRPPFGLRMLVEPLALKLPLGAFNGGTIVGPVLDVIECALIPQPAAERAIGFLQERGLKVWLFTNERWLVAGIDEYLPRERRAIDAEPEQVADFSNYTDGVSKIVGVSDDAEKVRDAEQAARHELQGVSAARSQDYYLDITPSGIDKGTFVRAMAARTGVPLARVATIGDMQNDVPMFRAGGISYAMGNAAADVKSRATRVTASNAEDGFARAIDDLLR